jgi:hypothetical protein
MKILQQLTQGNWGHHYTFGRYYPSVTPLAAAVDYCPLQSNQKNENYLKNW